MRLKGQSLLVPQTTKRGPRRQTIVPPAEYEVTDMPMLDKVPMTSDGHQAMLDEIKHLKSVERPRIIKAITEARAHGDLAENAEYHAAKDQQGWIEARVAELEDKVSRAEVIDVSKLSGDTVKFGAHISLDRRGYGRRSGLPDRRRVRGGREEGQDLGYLPHRPRHHRQEEG